MRDALVDTGRDIFYSICNWGNEETWQWAPATGNSWRTTKDIKNSWESVESNFRENLLHFERSGPGGWNDPDMLEVGVHDNFSGVVGYGLTVVEEQTHFALWAISKAPLIIGANLNDIRDESLAIYKNSWLIAVNQDPESNQASCFYGCDDTDILSIYVSRGSDGCNYGVWVNWGDDELAPTSIDLGSLGIIPTPS